MWNYSKDPKRSPAEECCFLVLDKLKKKLLSRDDAKRTASYVMMASPFPYKEYTVNLIIDPKPNDNNKCVLTWKSWAYATIDEVDKAHKVAQEGLQGAMNIVRQTVEKK